MDNRRENLRVVTQRENCRNYKKHREGHLAGVFSYKSKKKPWAAYFHIGNKKIWIGAYADKMSAHKAYLKACEDHRNGK